MCIRGTGPFKLGSTAAAGDGLLIIDDKGNYYAPFIKDLWIQQLGDDMGLVSKYGNNYDVVSRRDAKIFCHYNTTPIPPDFDSRPRQ